MQFLEWLTAWPISTWIQESEWGFPVFLAFHSIGLAVVLGVLVMLDVRILGFAKSFPVSSFSKLMTWAWGGFIINAISGIILFAADASRLSVNWAFIMKMTCVVLGVITAWLMSRQLNFPAYTYATDAEADAMGEPVVTKSLRYLAIASLVIWTMAIVAGRLIAYINDSFALSGSAF
jgi:hypothetical protein